MYIYTACVRYNRSRDDQGGKRSGIRQNATTSALFLMKKSTKVVLYFGLDCGNSVPTSRNPKNNWYLSHILEHPSAEKISVWAHANRDRNKQEVGFIFAWSGSELWTLIKYSRSKIKIQKPKAVDVLFQAYPMVPLSCRSNLARWYL